MCIVILSINVHSNPINVHGELMMAEHKDSFSFDSRTNPVIVGTKSRLFPGTFHTPISAGPDMEPSSVVISLVCLCFRLCFHLCCFHRLALGVGRGEWQVQIFSALSMHILLCEFRHRSQLLLLLRWRRGYRGRPDVGGVQAAPRVTTLRLSLTGLAKE